MKITSRTAAHREYALVGSGCPVGFMLQRGYGEAPQSSTNDAERGARAFCLCVGGPH